MKQQILNKRQALFLQLLKNSRPRERKVLLSGAENAIIKVLSEVIYNMLHGNVSLGNDKIRQLRRYKQILQTMSNRSVSLDQKRTLLHQYGGGGLLTLLLPILSTVFGS
jgi:hypothetical protein